MSKLPEIQSAILTLPAKEREALREWLEQIDNDPALLAAIDAADHSLEIEGGVPIQVARRKLRQWITG